MDTDWKAEYYACFVTRMEAEEFRSRCYFASNFHNAVKQDPSKEFELLFNEWNAYTERQAS